MRTLLKKSIPNKLKNKLNDLFVSLSIKHVYGPKKVILNCDESAVTCLVKNGDYYINQFIEHYGKMGFKHIFFLDNGSTDNTISIAKKYPNVSIYRTDLPVSKYQPLLKKSIAMKAVRGGWCLDVDIDEFFGYPFSDTITINHFLQYLNNHKYTAVITQMLDMFSDNTLSDLENGKSDNLKAKYKYYDISAIDKMPYNSSEIATNFGKDNILPNNIPLLYFGGIRKILYNLNCMLTKHSLFSRQTKLDLFPHVHFINNAKIADISCVLFHYKLTSNALEIAYQNKNSFETNSRGYSDFIELIKAKPEYQIKKESAFELKGINDLVINGFLSLSQEFKTYFAINN